MTPLRVYSRNRSGCIEFGMRLRQPLQIANPDTLKKSCLEEARSIKSSAIGELDKLGNSLATKDHRGI